MPTTRWMQTEWRSVTPFDSLLAIRQKRGGEAPSEDPPKTRENRITAVGNDLYSADSRSFLNPFLRISRCTRLFPLHPWQHPYPSNCLPRLLSPSATDPVSLSLSLHHPGNLRRSFARVTRFRETEIVLSRKSCPLSSHTANRRLHYAHSHAFSARRMFSHARKHRYPILLLSQ